MFSQACVKNSVQGWACMHPRTLMPPGGYYEMRSMSGRYAILLECILVSMSILFYKKRFGSLLQKEGRGCGLRSYRSNFTGMANANTYIAGSWILRNHHLASGTFIYILERSIHFESISL